MLDVYNSKGKKIIDLFIRQKELTSSEGILYSLVSWKMMGHSSQCSIFHPINKCNENGMLNVDRNITVNTIILTLVGIILCTVDKVTSYHSTPTSIRRCPINSVNIETTPCNNFGTITTPLHLQISDVPYEDDSGLSYAERIRPYRRDVFDSDEWVRIRSTSRFSTNLYGLFKSGVVRQLLTVQEAILILCVATFICLYNALLVNGYNDFVGIHHDPLLEGFYEISLPSMVFTLTSAPLSLLLRKSICRCFPCAPQFYRI
jgi:hypothetical protein